MAKKAMKRNDAIWRRNEEMKRRRKVSGEVKKAENATA
jgi:hypothetical protein